MTPLLNGMGMTAINYYGLLATWQKFNRLNEDCTKLDDGLLQLKSKAGSAFPATDIAAIESSGNLTQVTVTFMGLYGVDSPLPAHINDLTLYDTEQAEVFRQFLDVFNHRIYALLYQAWKKFQLDIASDLGDDSFDRLTKQFITHPTACEKYPLTSALKQNTRVSSAIELTRLLGENFGFDEVAVYENGLSCIKVDTPPLQSNSKLSLANNSLLGGVILDRTRNVIINVKINSLKKYQAFQLNDKDKLSRFLSTYLGAEFTFTIKLKLNFKADAAQQLGDKSLRLGITSYLSTANSHVACEQAIYQ